MTPFTPDEARCVAPYVTHARAPGKVSIKPAKPSTVFKKLRGKEAKKNLQDPPLALEVDDSEFKLPLPYLKVWLVNRTNHIQEVHISS